MARLEAGLAGQSSSWHAITRKTEAFPGSPPPTPADHVTGTGPKNQATTETATAGTWTEAPATRRVHVQICAEPAGISGIPTIRISCTASARDPHLAGRRADERPGDNAVYTFIPATGFSSAPLGPAARSSTTTPATPATTISRRTAARASTCSTARCATSRSRSTRSRATPST